MLGKTVAVLRGGSSSEYHVSMQTGAGVLKALQELDIASRDIIISREGEWYVDGYARRPEMALLGVDVVFIALHGAYGEDGCVQRVLENLSIPYTGSGPYASAIAMNKVLTKEYLQAVGVKTPKFMRLNAQRVHDPIQTALSIGELFGPEYFIKPVFGGSSIGTRMASNVGELGSALSALLIDHPDLLVEERIRGREATAGVLEQYRDQKLYSMPVVEIIPPAHTNFFSEEVKYTGETQEICPGRFSKEEKQELEAVAQQVHEVLNLRHYSRSDFIVADDGIYFLEVNTLPGLTSESLFPKAVEAVGGGYTELIKHLVTIAQ
jgi:D-alanine-D-alanine ligase